MCLYMNVCICVCTVCVWMVACIYVYINVCMCILIYMRVCIMLACVMCVGVNSPSLCVCLVVWYSNADSLVRSEPVTGDSDLIRIRIRCGPDTLAIRRLTYEMIRRFVPVHAVKTRQRFHVSVCSHVFSLSTVSSRCLFIYSIISCDHLIYFTSMITLTIPYDVSECTL